MKTIILLTVVFAIVGIELLAAAQGCDFHGTMKSSVALEAVRALLRARVATLNDDRYLHGDMQEAIALVRSGDVTRAVSSIDLPAICESAP